MNWIINGHLNLLLRQVSGQQGAVSAPGGNGRSTAMEFFYSLSALFFALVLHKQVMYICSIQCCCFCSYIFFGAYNGQGLCNYYQEITRLSYQKQEVRTAHGVNLALL